MHHGSLHGPLDEVSKPARLPAMSNVYRFLVDTYETERINILSVWSEFEDRDLPVRSR